MPAYDVYEKMRAHPLLQYVLSTKSTRADVVTGHDFGGRFLSRPNQSPHIIWVPSPDTYGPPVMNQVRVQPGQKGPIVSAFAVDSDDEGDMIEGIHTRREGVSVHLYEVWYPDLDVLIKRFIMVLREVCVAVGNYSIEGGQPISYTQVREGTVGYQLNVRISSPIYDDYRTALPRAAPVQMPTLQPPPDECPSDPDEARRWRYRRVCRWRRGLEERVDGDLAGEESALRGG